MMQQTSWNLHLYPRGSEDPDFIALFLKRCDNCSGPEKIALNFELSILDANGRDLESEKIELNDLEFQKSASHGISDFFERPKNIREDRVFTLDILRVRCTMWIDEGEVDKEVLSYAKTRIGHEKISFINTIESFATLKPNLKITFDVTSVSKDALKLSGNVYVRSEPGSEDEVMVEISLDSQNAHLITCQICMLNSAGKEVECGEGEVDKEDLSYAKTRIALENISFINTIESFATLKPNQKITFNVTSVSKDALKLSGNVYVRSEPCSEDEVKVEISLDSQNAHLITCQICMLNSAGKEVECGKIDTRNDLCRKSTLVAPLNFEKSNLLDEKHEYLPNDKLTLRCECTLSTGIEFQSIEETFY
ncbi:hypothetical protein AVEN_250062-1, partial [Araneus ventricosus]